MESLAELGQEIREASAGVSLDFLRRSVKFAAGRWLNRTREAAYCVASVTKVQCTHGLGNGAGIIAAGRYVWQMAAVCVLSAPRVDQTQCCSYWRRLCW